MASPPSAAQRAAWSALWRLLLADPQDDEQAVARSFPGHESDSLPETPAASTVIPHPMKSYVLHPMKSTARTSSLT